jgi:hypothetical protein
MTTNSDLCHHPEDIAACRRLLVKTKRDEAIDRHCILNGLREGRDQCRRVLLEGLAKQESQDTTACGSPPELRQACDEVLLCGYPLGIKAIPEIFYEAYWKYVRSIIRKRLGSNKRTQSDQDDIFQTTFEQLHERLQKGGETIACLKGYVATVTVNTCSNPRFRSKETRLEDEESIIIRHQNPSMELVPPDVVDTWEDQDYRLVHTNQGDLINRIILAHVCIDGWSTSKPPSAKDLKLSWSLLRQMPHTDIASLMENAIKEAQRLQLEGVVRKVAHCVNSRLANKHQVAVVFAAAIGQSQQEINDLIEKLTGLSKPAIYSRISRMYEALWQARE